MIEQDSKITQILTELGEPSAEDMAELRRLLPPVVQGTSSPSRPTGNLATGRRRARR